MRITLKQLEYFIATAKVGSIKIASQQIYISQPSISSAISHLEEELQVQLFVRHHAKGLDLTMSGKRIFKAAKILVKHAEKLYLLGSELNNKVSGKITIGCMITLAPVIMAELGQQFTNKYPAVELSLVEGSHSELVEMLRSVEVDAAITYDLDFQEGIKFTSLAKLPPHAIFSPNHPFANLSSVALEQLQQEPFILLDLPYTKEYFLALFNDHGLKPNIKHCSSNPEMVRAMVANEFGYSLANIRPNSLISLDGRKLVSVELQGKNKPMKIGMSVLVQKYKPMVLKAFEQHCRDTVTDLVIPGMTLT